MWSPWILDEGLGDGRGSRGATARPSQASIRHTHCVELSAAGLLLMWKQRHLQYSRHGTQNLPSHERLQAWHSHSAQSSAVRNSPKQSTKLLTSPDPVPLSPGRWDRTSLGGALCSGIAELHPRPGGTCEKGCGSALLTYPSGSPCQDSWTALKGALGEEGVPRLSESHATSLIVPGSQEQLLALPPKTSVRVHQWLLSTPQRWYRALPSCPCSLGSGKHSPVRGPLGKGAPGTAPL